MNIQMQSQRCGVLGQWVRLRSLGATGFGCKVKDLGHLGFALCEYPECITFSFAGCQVNMSKSEGQGLGYWKLVYIVRI